ncbi:MAG TPA: hypothetical protein VK790_12845 [Solirubrobacteraceae bacterium]|jgi:hypothetical protein|nr:hypothetical protein [Solirubrobacteraceae bacterium]
MRSKKIKGCAVFGLSLALVALLVAFGYSHVDPERLGTCQKVALYFGKHAFAEDCEPYASGDFAAASALLGFLLILVSGLSGSIKTPLGTLRWEREAEKVRDELNVSPDQLERRAEQAIAGSQHLK